MKKALAIFIALCLMCSSLAVGIVLADSTKEVVVVPAISETDKPAMGSQGNYGGGAKTKVVENNAPLNLGWAMELIKDSGIGKGVCDYRGFTLNTEAKLSDYAGFMTYIKTTGPAKDLAFHFALNVKKADGSSVVEASHFSNTDEACILRTDNVAAGWLTTAGKHYGTNLPNPIEGWLYVDFASVIKNGVSLADGDEVTQIIIWDPGTGGIEKDGDKIVDETCSVTVTASAPVLVEKASVSNGKPISHTVALKKLPDAEQVAPALPEYTGDPIMYTGVDVAEVKTPYPHLKLNVGQKPESRQWNDYKDNADTQVIMGKLAIQQIPMIASNRATTGEGGTSELIGTYYTKFDEQTKLEPINSDKGKAYMLYLEIPDTGSPVKMRVGGAFIRKGTWTNVDSYSGSVDIMSVTEEDWTSVPIEAYYFTLPSGFKGMLRVKYDNFGDSSGQLLDGSDGLDYELASINFWIQNLPGGEDKSVIIGAPMVVTNLGNTGRAVYLNGDKTVARDMFTGMPLKSDEVKDPSNPDPNPSPEPVAPVLPAYTGDPVKYTGVDLTELKTPYPHLKLNVGKRPENRQWNDYKDNADTQVITGKLAIQQIPMFASNRATTNDGGMDELIGTYYTKFNEQTKLEPINSDKGVAYMFYVEVPDIDEEIPVRIYGAFIRDGIWTNVACYNGIADIMSIAEDTWTAIPIKGYYFNLPSGFKGMVRVKYDNFGDENGQLLDGSDGLDYELASVNYFIANLPGGEENRVIVGAPMVVTNLGNTGRAVYLNGDKAVARDLFTGAPLQSDEVSKSLQKGDFVTELPKGTLDSALTIGEVTTTAVPKWKKLENGYRYQIELYSKGVQNGENGYFVQEILSTYNKDRIQLTGILPEEEYTVVVRAFDAEGRVLGVYDPLSFSAASVDDGPHGDPGDPDNPKDNNDAPGNDGKDIVKTGEQTTIWLAVVLLISALAVVMVLRKRSIKN
mgnify:FL=1